MSIADLLWVSWEKNNTEQGQRKITSKSQDEPLSFEKHLNCIEYFIIISQEAYGFFKFFFILYTQSVKMLLIFHFIFPPESGINNE